jgi:exopolysaccharide biosynthesis polyprenyl glycosylphosphotransferase
MSATGQRLDYLSSDLSDLPSLDATMGSVAEDACPVSSASNFGRMVATVEAGLDFAISLLAVFVAYYTYYHSSIGRHIYYPPREVTFLALSVAILVVLLFERDAAYGGVTSLLRIRETERALKIPCLALGFLLPFIWLMGQSFSRWTVLLLAAILPVALILEKSFLSSFVEFLHGKGFGIRQVVIYGAGHTGRGLFTTLLNSPRVGFKPVAMVDHDPTWHGSQIFELGYSRRQSVYVDHGPITEDYLRSVGCDALFIAIPDLPREAMFGIMQAATATGCQVAFLPDRRHLNTHFSETVDLDGLLLTFAAQASVSRSYDLMKRLTDLAIATALLVVLSPLLLLIGVLVRCDSDGSAIFKQRRVGFNGKTFEINKFRTMYVDAPRYATSPVLSGDSRITRAGRFLRKTSLDELPQLWNVLAGDMSLVGPRPEMPFLVETYGPIQRQRLSVRPGMTGLWQLSADRAFLIHESPEYDLYYIRHRTFFLDLAILVHTAVFAMQGI